MAADWGVIRLLTIARADVAHVETVETEHNPRWYSGARELLAPLDRAVSWARG